MTREHEGGPPGRSRATPGTAFTQTASFPAAFRVAIGMALVAEGLALHAWLSVAHPRIAWTFSALTVASLVWLVGRRRATVLRTVVIDGRTLSLRSGPRLAARLDLDADVASIERATWRTTPPSGAADYLNAARPSTPNVLVTLRQPTAVAGPLSIKRRVTRIGIALDDPAGFLALVAL